VSGQVYTSAIYPSEKVFVHIGHGYSWVDCGTRMEDLRKILFLKHCAVHSLAPTVTAISTKPMEGGGETAEMKMKMLNSLTRSVMRRG